VFFNDPVPCPDPAERAVKMAVAMREAARKLIAAWSRHGCELGFGVGIAQGFATLGQIGFSERSGYTAIGTVCRFVARINSRAQSASRSDIYVRRTYSGRPSSSMRFSEAAAMAISVVCRPPVRERSASPITRL
jgi:hypothetical protein